jgi:type VI protein secretion system component VasA
MISFGTAENAGVLPQADLLSIDMLATNKKLASAVRAGEISVATPSSPAYAKFANRANDLRVEAIKEVRVTPGERLYRGAPVRGINVDVDLDEAGFAGDGDMFLFGAVLDRLFGAYVSLNSFAKTTIHGVQTKAVFPWPARSGNLTIV